MIDVHATDDRILTDTREEAIAIACVGMEPGDEITIHAEDCAIDAVTLDGCTCEPETYVVGEANEA